MVGRFHDEFEPEYNEDSEIEHELLPEYMVRPVIATRVLNNELICANIFRVY